MKHPELGEPGMLGLMSLWADRCPFQSNCGKVSSVEGVGGGGTECEKGSEKRGKEVRKKYTCGDSVYCC